jgi:hypothetical protein
VDTWQSLLTLLSIKYSNRWKWFGPLEAKPLPKTIVSHVVKFVRAFLRVILWVFFFCLLETVSVFPSSQRILPSLLHHFLSASGRLS